MGPAPEQILQPQIHPLLSQEERKCSLTTTLVIIEPKHPDLAPACLLCHLCVGSSPGHPLCCSLQRGHEATAVNKAKSHVPDETLPFSSFSTPPQSTILPADGLTHSLVQPHGRLDSQVVAGFWPAMPGCAARSPSPLQMCQESTWNACLPSLGMCAPYPAALGRKHLQDSPGTCFHILKAIKNFLFRFPFPLHCLMSLKKASPGMLAEESKQGLNKLSCSQTLPQ